MLFFLEAGCGLAVANRQILQLTLATLVADRAIQRVVDQQKLHHTLLRRHSQLRMREYLHAIGHGGCAGRQRLRRLFHLNQTHPAIGRDRQLLVIAEMRDVDAQLAGSIHDGRAVVYLRLFAVDFNF